jgi:hypothetical protein
MVFSTKDATKILFTNHFIYALDNTARDIGIIYQDGGEKIDINRLQ